MSKQEVRKVRTIFNPKSGLWWSIEGVRKVLDEHWDVDGIDLTYQISKSPQDGRNKARRAVESGVDTIIVVGGDGIINTIGSELVGTNTAIAVIPAGSGNGFARHFDIPLSPDKAAETLRNGHRQKIDVGIVNNSTPFFVNCGLAWDADIVKGFEKSPIRGVIPYIFSGIYRYFTYEPQDFELILDGSSLIVENPLVLTIANLTMYGGGATIAPDAKPDDGELELVVVRKGDPVQFLSQIHRLFDGSIKEAPIVETYKFKHMQVKRERPDPIQVDGELVESEREFQVNVRPGVLDVIVP